jgi:hypothetical protein
VNWGPGISLAQASPIAHRVPRNSLRSRNSVHLLLSEYDGNSGELLIGEGTVDVLEPLGALVALDSYYFTRRFDAVVYIADSQRDGTGTLTARFSTGDVFELATGVVESREIGVPAAGILYSVAGPEERAGVWYARAR